jgi:stress response protein SCP2
MNLQKGQKVDITKQWGFNDISVQISWKSMNPSMEVDASAFLLSGSGKCEQDENFIFYANPISPDKAVSYTKKDHVDQGDFILSWKKLNPSYQKIAFTLTIHEGDQLGQHFSQVSQIRLDILDSKTKQSYFAFDFGSGLTRETAIVAGEFYLHNGDWKFNAIGSGFFGGLADLCNNYGLEVETTVPTAPVIAPKPESNINLNKIDLLKKQVEISLSKKNIANQKARVAVVFDDSGSMYGLYLRGVVQRAFEKILAVASSMDDDEQLDVWFFADESKRAGSVTSADFQDYINRTHEPGSVGIGNNEPDVMLDIIKKYTKEEPNAQLPAYIIFFSDGGIYYTEEIAEILIESSKLNIFWQFVGLGEADYGVLEKLDNLPGRVVDNANFFALDDFDTVSDSELYDRLLNEFPEWLKEARKKGILK